MRKIPIFKIKMLNFKLQCVIRDFSVSTEMAQNHDSEQNIQNIQPADMNHDVNRIDTGYDHPSTLHQIFFPLAKEIQPLPQDFPPTLRQIFGEDFDAEN